MPGLGEGARSSGGLGRGEDAAQPLGRPSGAGGRLWGRRGLGARARSGSRGGDSREGPGAEGPGAGGPVGPQAAPGRRSPRPCPSGRSGPWRRREARLARSLAHSALGPSAPAPAAASTGSTRPPASLPVRGSSGCHVGQALKGPRRRARPGRALKGPRAAFRRPVRRARGSARRVLAPAPRPPRWGLARRALAPAAPPGPARCALRPRPPRSQAPPIERSEATPLEGRAGAPAGAVRAGAPGAEGAPPGRGMGRPPGAVSTEHAQSRVRAWVRARGTPAAPCRPRGRGESALGTLWRSTRCQVVPWWGGQGDENPPVWGEPGTRDLLQPPPSPLTGLPVAASGEAAGGRSHPEPGSASSAWRGPLGALCLSGPQFPLLK